MSQPPLHQDANGDPPAATSAAKKPTALPGRGFLTSLLMARCPRCREGRMFKSLMTMNDPCPVCRLVFQREEGYYLGAMYCSYVLGLTILTPTFFLLSALLPRWDGVQIAMLSLVPYLPLIPFVFRYSRVLWIYFDRTFDPTDLSAGAYEKERMRQMR
jgi:uncharacterized protein (DUF983 family)